jgi:hypothetical protein
MENKEVIQRKLATALIKIANENEPPKRWLAGADALQSQNKRKASSKKQIEA